MNRERAINGSFLGRVQIGRKEVVGCRAMRRWELLGAGQCRLLSCRLPLADWVGTAHTLWRKPARHNTHLWKRGVPRCQTEHLSVEKGGCAMPDCQGRCP